MAAPTVALVNNAARAPEFMTSVEAVARENGEVISAGAQRLRGLPGRDVRAHLAGAGPQPPAPELCAQGRSRRDWTGPLARRLLGAGLHTPAGTAYAAAHGRRAQPAQCAGRHRLRFGRWGACHRVAGPGSLPRAVKGRSEIKHDAHGRLIDDTYNANPTACAAIDVLVRPAPRRNG